MANISFDFNPLVAEERELVHQIEEAEQEADSALFKLHSAISALVEQRKDMRTKVVALEDFVEKVKKAANVGNIDAMVGETQELLKTLDNLQYYLNTAVQQLDRVIEKAKSSQSDQV
jgi:phage shock protein A